MRNPLLNLEAVSCSHRILHCHPDPASPEEGLQLLSQEWGLLRTLVSVDGVDQTKTMDFFCQEFSHFFLNIILPRN